MARVLFTANELRAFQPALAARLEEEIAEGAADTPQESPLQCRVGERRTGGRPHITVQLAAHGWTVAFAVDAPPAVGEVRMETRRVLRGRNPEEPRGRGGAAA